MTKIFSLLIVKINVFDGTFYDNRKINRIDVSIERGLFFALFKDGICREMFIHN